LPRLAWQADSDKALFELGEIGKRPRKVSPAQFTVSPPDRSQFVDFRVQPPVPPIQTGVAGIVGRPSAPELSRDSLNGSTQGQKNDNSDYVSSIVGSANRTARLRKLSDEGPRRRSSTFVSVRIAAVARWETSHYGPTRHLLATYIVYYKLVRNISLVYPCSAMKPHSFFDTTPDDLVKHLNSPQQYVIASGRNHLFVGASQINSPDLSPLTTGCSRPQFGCGRGVSEIDQKARNLATSFSSEKRGNTELRDRTHLSLYIALVKWKLADCVYAAPNAAGDSGAEWFSGIEFCMARLARLKSGINLYGRFVPLSSDQIMCKVKSCPAHHSRCRAT
jgi:hypothetical protein